MTLVIGCSHQVAKTLELQLQHQSFSEYSGLISFRIDSMWEDSKWSPLENILNVAGTALKALPLFIFLSKCVREAFLGNDGT